MNAIPSELDETSSCNTDNAKNEGERWLGVSGLTFYNSLSIVRQGKQSPTYKKTVPHKPIPTWNDITKVPPKLSVPPKVKCLVRFYVKFKLLKVFKMTGVKIIMDRLLLIGISTQKDYIFSFVYTFVYILIRSYVLQSTHLHENEQTN